MDKLVTVRAYLNTARDALGTPLGMLSGYQPGHEVTLAFEAALPATRDEEICEQIFRLLNVGDDPEFGTPDPRAVAYRNDGHRSLSVGDLVIIDNRAYACARIGFTPVALPPAAVGRPHP